MDYDAKHCLFLQLIHITRETLQLCKKALGNTNSINLPVDQIWGGMEQPFKKFVYELNCKACPNFISKKADPYRGSPFPRHSCHLTLLETATIIEIHRQKETPPPIPAPTPIPPSSPLMLCPF